MEQDLTLKESPRDTVVMEHAITPGMAFPSMRAARNFSQITELLVITGDYMSLGDLASLCRVDRRFNAVFSQFLYKHVRLDFSFLQPENLARYSTSRRFMNTTILTSDETTQFCARDVPGYSHGFGGLKTNQATDWACDLVLKAGIGILRHAPNVHTIFIDSTFIGSDNAILLLNNGLDDKFKQSSHHLQWLSLILGCRHTRELSVSIFQEQCLQLLCLINIPTGLWSKDVLCQILKASPQLKYLELSYLYALEHRWAFETICEQYKELGGQPLELKSLVLGPGVILKLPAAAPSSNADADRPASYLALLADLISIEEISIVASGGFAWGTFDSSFLPKVKDLHLIASSNFGFGAYRSVSDFFSKSRARSFLSQVHLHVEGDVFEDYPHFRGMTRQLFAPRNENDPTSSLAPLGFTFPYRLLREDKYKVSIPMPLPTTRCLDVAINYRHLVNFAGSGLSKMAALHDLRLTIHTYDSNDWNDRDEVYRNQMEALAKAASKCPNLQYVRMEMETSRLAFLSTAGLSRSWKITWEREPGSHSQKLVPRFQLLGERADWSLRPRSMWTNEEKKAEYVKDTKVPLNYLGSPRG